MCYCLLPRLCAHQLSGCCGCGNVAFGFGDDEKENAIKQTTTAQRQIADKTKTNDFDFKDDKKENAIKQTAKTQEQIASKTGANEVKQLRVNSPALIKIDEVKVNADAPLMPAQASVIKMKRTGWACGVTPDR